MKNPITVFTKNGCIQCKMTKRFLNEHNVHFEERNINNQPQYLDYLKQQGFQSVPVVMAADNNPIVGFRPDELKELTH
ncbi:MAG: glutaredoxin-like protein NrdH [Lactobacillus sp.]|jgi:glutaredoxin-like protein NrdH|uniref:Glutaredoxin-like protein NrdH n=1 Tax=Bombilactobacillus bombi TaxID=1303590 RepID=A0A347SSZ3_9LACO|nr:glutaredoxin-like protein NrdH [Bombilactobacillus bombi]MCO6541192.1 glutaredoxin-like protein NrdH [Lactobacillus sp.]AXX65152.1 glutaredoxin-like protein NrdH [Bombilactobacillus bombi]MCO6543452.1 glutaredoxin-like protein NrdH [Lactobacillus sp.]RHW48836.1 NrdH-redoxin [Bombilactobacillus bombi]RHW51115.1 NrdH-redoxin [Bombilactobacillus bombi]